MKVERCKICGKILKTREERDFTGYCHTCMTTKHLVRCKVCGKLYLGDVWDKHFDRPCPDCVIKQELKEEIKRRISEMMEGLILYVLVADKLKKGKEA